ncbi:GDSL-type esterase/lipase family protein [Nocardia niigatensis]
MLVACRRRAIGFDFDGVAALASEITGRTIKRVTVSDEDFRQQLVSYGVPLWQADMMVDIFTAARAGEFATVEPTLAELIGREPIGLDTVLREALPVGRSYCRKLCKVLQELLGSASMTPQCRPTSSTGLANGGRRGGGAAVAMLAALAVHGMAPAAAEPVPDSGVGAHWVSTWMAAPSDSFSVVDPSVAPQLHLSDQTYRLIATPHRGGATLRIHLTNRTRPTPVEFTHVTIAKQSEGAAVQPDSMREVTFDGSPSVTAAAYGEVLSDPIDLPFGAFEPLAVSVYVAGPAVLPTEHFDANATSFYSLPFAGDTTGDPAGAGLPLRTTSMPFLSGLDVRAPEAVSTIVALGDSITDGYVASNVLGIPQDPVVVDRAQRYPDFLQHRLDQAGLPFSVVDAGISGNRLTRDGLIPQFGPAAPTRLQPDILDQPGVTDVIILEGINDLGIPVGASYDQLASGYTNLIDRLHAAGLRVHLGTILPAANALNDGILTFPTADPVRRQLNSWIRGQQLADSVIDFDAALRDPADPSVLAPRYAGADNLHPNAAGHRAMADAIDLTSFGGRS